MDHISNIDAAVLGVSDLEKLQSLLQNDLDLSLIHISDEFSAFPSGGRPSLTVSIVISLIRYKASLLHGSFPWPSSGALDY